MSFLPYCIRFQIYIHLRGGSRRLTGFELSTLPAAFPSPQSAGVSSCILYPSLNVRVICRASATSWLTMTRNSRSPLRRRVSSIPFPPFPVRARSNGPYALLHHRAAGIDLADMGGLHEPAAGKHLVVALYAVVGGPCGVPRRGLLSVEGDQRLPVLLVLGV